MAVRFHPGLSIAAREHLLNNPHKIRITTTKTKPSKRDATDIARFAVFEDQLETSALGRRRDYDPVAPGSEGSSGTLGRMATLSELDTLQRNHNVELQRRVERGAQAVAADRRRFNPEIEHLPFSSWASTPWEFKSTFGNSVKVAPHVDANGQSRLKATVAGITIPCIQRAQRREVMFALRKNKGHRTPKRPRSEVYC